MARGIVKAVPRCTDSVTRLMIGEVEFGNGLVGYSARARAESAYLAENWKT